MDPARMPPRARGGAMSWVATLAFHAALIAICAIVVISTPTRIVPDMGIDLRFQSSAGTPAAGEQDAAPSSVRSVRPIDPNGPGTPEVSGNAPHGVETREGPLPAASAVEVPSMQPGDRQVEDAARDSSGI